MQGKGVKGFLTAKAGRRTHAQLQKSNRRRWFMKVHESSSSIGSE